MAKKKDGNDNSYTPIKNPELLQGQPDTRPIGQIVQDGQSEHAKKEHETWVDHAERTTEKPTPSFAEHLSRQRTASTDKDISKQEPEKDM